MNRRPASLPLRQRLALGYSLFFALVLLLMNTGVYWLVRNALLNEVAQELAVSADLIRQDVSFSGDVLSGHFRDPDTVLQALPPRIEGLESPALYVQVFDREQRLIALSASLGGQGLPLDPQAYADALGGRTTNAIVTLGAGRVMQLTTPLGRADQTVGVLLVAQSLSAVDQALRVLLFGLTGTSLVAVAAAVRGGIWLARRALRPVEEIAQTTRQIVRAADLSRRVPEVTQADELATLTSTVNEMLARLEQLFTAQRRFVADVSHELRTPLTAMRGRLELLRRGVVRDGVAQAESVDDLLREVNRLSRMANDLLLLAQTEVGVQLRRESFALDELVLEVVRELRPLAEGVDLRPEFSEQVAVVGDRDRLKQALLNLVANALQHTPSGGRVMVALRCEPEAALLEVRDTGSGIPAADLPHVFERFYQADSASGRRSAGVGLGLAIVHWVAEAHGGSVAVQSAQGQGTTFSIRLPLRPTAHKSLMMPEV